MKNSEFKTGLNAELKSNNVFNKVTKVYENEDYQTVIVFESNLRGNEIEYLMERFNKQNTQFGGNVLVLKGF